MLRPDEQTAVRMMTDAAATIIAGLIGFVGGLIVAVYGFRQKADELFLAGLQYLEGGSQKRNLGIAAMELSWSSRRHRRVISPLLVGVASYLLLESGQKDAVHEIENLRRIMKLLTSHRGRSSLGDEAKASLLDALKRKSRDPGTDPGLWVTSEQLDDWRKRVEAA
jgi:hypothetical protein